MTFDFFALSQDLRAIIWDHTRPWNIAPLTLSERRRVIVSGTDCHVYEDVFPVKVYMHECMDGSLSVYIRYRDIVHSWGLVTEWAPNRTIVAWVPEDDHDPLHDNFFACLRRGELAKAPSRSHAGLPAQILLDYARPSWEDVQANPHTHGRLEVCHMRSRWSD